MINKKNNLATAVPIIAASYLGPALKLNQDAEWSESLLPLNADELVQEIMGQPMRRAGRFIKMVCCGALACLKSIPPETLKDRKIGIFLATGLGNIDEVLPFIKQVFKYDGGFPSPNQFANSVSNAAAFFLAKVCEVKGVVLTISQEELSFESALWLAQSYLASGEIDLAMVGGCDVFTPTFEDYRERLNITADN
ncbi:MAG: beta-ketoacyl synthase N-terminal-like domain-containing protein, partial [Smithella sp.]